MRDLLFPFSTGAAHTCLALWTAWTSCWTTETTRWCCVCSERIWFSENKTNSRLNLSPEHRPQSTRPPVWGRPLFAADRNLSRCNWCAKQQRYWSPTQTRVCGVGKIRAFIFPTQQHRRVSYDTIWPIVFSKNKNDSLVNDDERAHRIVIPKCMTEIS